MKTSRTTLNLPSDLLRDAKVLAAHRDTTLTELVTQGLRKVLGYTEDMDPKKSLSEFLETYTPPTGVKPLTLEEQDKRYREAMLKKHG